MLLTQLDVQASGLESLRDLYANDTDFSMPFAKSSAVKAWENTICMMDTYFELTNYVCPSRPCVCYCCRSHIVAV